MLHVFVLYVLQFLMWCALWRDKWPFWANVLWSNCFSYVLNSMFGLPLDFVWVQILLRIRMHIWKYCWWIFCVQRRLKTNECICWRHWSSASQESFLDGAYSLHKVSCENWRQREREKSYWAVPGWVVLFASLWPQYCAQLSHGEACCYAIMVQ